MAFSVGVIAGSFFLLFRQNAVISSKRFPSWKTFALRSLPNFSDSFSPVIMMKPMASPSFRRALVTSVESRGFPWERPWRMSDRAVSISSLIRFTSSSFLFVVPKSESAVRTFDENMVVFKFNTQISTFVFFRIVTAFKEPGFCFWTRRFFYKCKRKNGSVYVQYKINIRIHFSFNIFYCTAFI